MCPVADNSRQLTKLDTVKQKDDSWFYELYNHLTDKQWMYLEAYCKWVES